MSEPIAPEAEAPVVEQVEPAAAPEPTFDTKYVERLRTEAGKYRTERNDATSKLNAVLGALGIGDRQEDPAAAVERYKTEARQAQVEAAIYRSVPEGVDAQALLDSRAFTSAIGSIEPGDQAALRAAVDQFIEANPRFRTAPQAPAGWGDAVAGRTPPTHTTQDAQALSVLGF